MTRSEDIASERQLLGLLITLPAGIVLVLIACLSHSIYTYLFGMMGLVAFLCASVLVYRHVMFGLATMSCALASTDRIRIHSLQIPLSTRVMLSDPEVLMVRYQQSECGDEHYEERIDERSLKAEINRTSDGKVELCLNTTVAVQSDDGHAIWRLHVKIRTVFGTHTYRFLLAPRTCWEH